MMMDMMQSIMWMWNLWMFNMMRTMVGMMQSIMRMWLLWMFKCYLNGDGYDVIYYVNENFVNEQRQLNYGDLMKSISNLKILILSCWYMDTKLK